MGMPQEADSLEFAAISACCAAGGGSYCAGLRGILAAGAYIAGSHKAYTAMATVNVTATGINQSQGAVR